MSALLAAVVAVVLVVALRRRRNAQLDPRCELASVAVHLARSTRAGSSIRDALRDSIDHSAGVVAEQLAALKDRLDRGASLDEALVRWRSDAAEVSGARGAPTADDVELLCAAVRFADRQGSGSSHAFEGVGEALVDRSQLEDELAALTAQSRASVWVLCGLPVLGLAMVASIEPSVPALLLGTPLGWVLLCAAACLDATALWISSRLATRVLR